MVLANELVRLDSRSGGHMILGTSIGRLEEEFEGLGIQLPGVYGLAHLILAVRFGADVELAPARRHEEIHHS